MSASIRTSVQRSHFQKFAEKCTDFGDAVLDGIASSAQRVDANIVQPATFLFVWLPRARRVAQIALTGIGIHQIYRVCSSQ